MSHAYMQVYNSVMYRQASVETIESCNSNLSQQRTMSGQDKSCMNW